MCGIAGKVSFSTAAVGDADVLRMIDAIKHRGPDDSGIYISPDRAVGLGHRRLSVIDLSPLGHQPMHYGDGLVVIFNGEIYNFQEQKEALQREGRRFCSQSDTEVILALYAKYGVDCVHHLRGMFAFAIYDEREGVLFCARDRVGKKPLKYYVDDRVFLFASELKGILTQPEYSREVDYAAIHHYLTLQYCPHPLTGFKGIRKLAPGSWLRLDVKKRRLQVQRYWSIDYSSKLRLSEPEWEHRILEGLEQATRIRMVADVPIGAFLSGGIDSSAVVAMMARNSSRPVKTFSVGFAEDRYNELPYARKIAERFGTEHTEFVVEPKAAEILPQLAFHYEEPYADSSALPTFYLARLTRQHVTVALNGDGGDECFAGYGRYSAFKFSLLCERLPLQRAALGVTRWAARCVPSTFMDRAYRFHESLADDYKTRYTHYTSYFTNAQKARLYTSAFSAMVDAEDTYELVGATFGISGAADRTEQAVGADISNYLPNDLLAKVDIATMAVGLEARSPFLDHQFLEMTAQVPFDLKLKARNTKKYILKRALRGILPDSILHRPKMGFSLPIDHWFRSDLRSYVSTMLLDGAMVRDGYFNRAYVNEMLMRHATTQVDYAPRIWALLMLELWLQRYFAR